MKKLILLIISTTLLFSCHYQQTKNREEKTTENEQVNDIVNKTVSLTAEPNVFKLSEIPDTVTVTMTNHTNDTITTGLHYQIEHYKKNGWKEISPKDVLFHDLGWKVKPTDTENFEQRLYKDQISYKAGKYRIVKYYLNSDYKKQKSSLKSTPNSMLNKRALKLLETVDS